MLLTVLNSAPLVWAYL